MRFLDTNIVIHAVLAPKKQPRGKEVEIKKRAIAIFKRVNGGEKVLITTSHLTEISNILEARAGIGFATNFVRNLITKENVEVMHVDYAKYLTALAIAEEKNIGTIDAIAYVTMKEEGIEEIYTFDTHFNNLDVKIIYS